MQILELEALLLHQGCSQTFGRGGWGGREGNRKYFFNFENNCEKLENFQ